MRFFAHSISPASSRRGRNLCGGGSALASEAISGAFESRTSGSRLARCSAPTDSPSCDSAAAWNVRASTPSTPSAASRAFSSPAAFSVNVTARICVGGKRAGRDLIGDAVRDGGGLAGAGAGEDGDRAANRLGRLTLLVVQPLEDLLGAHRPTVSVRGDTAAMGRHPPYRWAAIPWPG